MIFRRGGVEVVTGLELVCWQSRCRHEGTCWGAVEWAGDWLPGACFVGLEQGGMGGDYFGKVQVAGSLDFERETGCLSQAMSCWKGG